MGSWVVGVNVLMDRLGAYRANPDETEFFGLMKRRVYVLDLRPSRFRPEGQRLRLITLATLIAGPVALFAFT